MMDYYDHDEREQKQMHHSSGAVRIYRSGPDEEGDSGGGIAEEHDKDIDNDDEDDLAI